MPLMEMVPILEYCNNVSNRIDESVLVVGGLYTAMFKFEVGRVWVARHTARIEEMAGDSLDDLTVQYVGIDDDMNPHGATYTANIQEGMLDFNGHVAPYIVTVCPEGHQHPAPFSVGFFMNHSEPFTPNDQLHTARDIDSSVLVPA